MSRSEKVGKSRKKYVFLRLGKLVSDRQTSTKIHYPERLIGKFYPSFS